MPFDYVPVSDVVPQQNLSLDRRDMTTVASKSPVDWAKVKAIYEKGANSKKGDGSARTFMGVATKKEVLAQFPNGAQVFGTADFLNANAQAVINGTGRAKGVGDSARKQLLDKALLTILYGEILEELWAAQEKVKQGNTDKAKGAPHNIDEAWAYYVGSKDGGKWNGPAGNAEKRENNFKLTGKIDEPLQRALAAAQAASIKGDGKALDAAVVQVRGHLNAIYYLSAIRYISNMVADTNVAERETHAAEGWGFLQAIRPAAETAFPGAKNAEAVYTRPGMQPATARDVDAVYAGLSNPKVLGALAIPAGLSFTKPPA